MATGSIGRVAQMSQHFRRLQTWISAPGDGGARVVRPARMLLVLMMLVTATRRPDRGRAARSDGGDGHGQRDQQHGEREGEPQPGGLAARLRLSGEEIGFHREPARNSRSGRRAGPPARQTLASVRPGDCAPAHRLACGADAILAAMKLESQDQGAGRGATSGSARALAGIAIVVLAGLGILVVMDVIPRHSFNEVAPKVLMIGAICAVAMVALGALSRR